MCCKLICLETSSIPRENDVCDSDDVRLVVVVVIFILWRLTTRTEAKPSIDGQ